MSETAVVDRYFLIDPMPCRTMDQDDECICREIIFENHIGQKI